ncbi:MAG: D-alanine--D-alanine ligase, partial [bacterium]|nr:D-alanine--D-alanine ligase [bacterium]
MKKVLVIFGGRSSEHDVSIITAQIIIDALKASGRYKAFPLYIAKNGSWYSEEQLSDINTYRQSDFEETLKSFKKVQLL